MIDDAPLLEACNVTRVFRTGLYFGTSFRAVDDVSFCFKQGIPEILVIAGESGCGKTTLAKMVLGILKPTRGKILYKGKDITKLKKQEKKAFVRDVQPVFQDPFETFNPFHRVVDYLKATALNLGRAESEEQAIEIIDKCLQRIGINPAEIYARFPHELSGGQLQRLSIVRALMASPSLLVADEPVSMVDASVRVEILNLLVELINEIGMSLMYITHDLATAYYVGAQTQGKIIILYRGDIMEQGLVEQVMVNPLHPYTKMLIEALPKPNPQERWKTKTKLSSLELREFQAPGCKFVSRCQYATSVCLEKRPPLIDIGNRSVRCWLMENHGGILS